MGFSPSYHGVFLKKWSTLRDRHPPRTVTKVTEFFWKFEAGFYSRIPWICTTGNGSKFKKQGRTDVRCLPRFCYNNHPISFVSNDLIWLDPFPKLQTLLFCWSSFPVLSGSNSSSYFFCQFTFNTSHLLPGQIWNISLTNLCLIPIPSNTSMKKQKNQSCPIIN